MLEENCTLKDFSTAAIAAFCSVLRVAVFHRVTGGTECLPGEMLAFFLAATVELVGRTCFNNVRHQL